MMQSVARIGAQLTLVCCVAMATDCQLIDRSAAAAADDLRFQSESGNTVFVPAGLPTDSGEIDLVVHFHGAPDVVVREFNAAGPAAVLLVVNYRGLSRAYETPMSDPRRFATLLEHTHGELSRRHRFRATARWRRVCVSSFSAGFGAVRALLQVPRYFRRIDALYLADTVYAGYTQDAEHRTVDPKNMAGFRRFASAAAAGDKTMIITHSYLQPDGYAGTHETADDLIAFVGLTRRAVREAGLNGMQLISRAGRGNFQVFGFAGTTGRDHMAHLRNMRFGFRMLVGSPWWHRFPVYVGDVGARAVDAELAAKLHAAMVSGNFGADPAWGPYGQQLSFLGATKRFEAIHHEGVRWITWMEAFGESMLYAATFDRDDDGSFRRRSDDPTMAAMVRSAWNWESAAGRRANADRWVGLHNTINDEDFVRPRFTRANLAFPIPHYPDGRRAVGDLPGVEYPLGARVYDAVGAKDINGRLAVELERLPERANRIDPASGKRLGSTEGLYRVTIDKNLARRFPDRKVGDQVFASIMYVGKDPAAPFWIEYARRMARELVTHGVDGLWCDNYSSFNNFGMPPIRNGFGDWSEQRFRDYLASSFTPHALRELGIDAAESFDIKAYLKQKAAALGAVDTSFYWDPAWRDRRWQDEPVWNAYKVFKQHVGQEALQAFYTAIKEETRLHGRNDFLIAGNDMPVYGLGWAHDQWLDMVSSEQTPGWFVTTGPRGIMLPPRGKYAVVYRAALPHQKGPYATVWYYLKGPYEKYRNRPGLAKVLSAEGFANATFLKYGGNPALPGTAESVAWWNRFVRAKEARFGHRKPLADIGLYFSPDNQLAFVVPGSHALDHNRQPHSFGHWGFGTALIDAHLPYRVVTDWKLSAGTLAGLKTLIVPSTECLDDTEVAVIERWVRDGGRLLVTGQCGLRHSTGGRFARRKRPVLLRWFPDAASRIEDHPRAAVPAQAAAAGSDPTAPLSDRPGGPAKDQENHATQRTTTKPLHRSFGRGSLRWSPEPLGMDYYVHETERGKRLPKIVDLIGPSDLVDTTGLASTVGMFLWKSCDDRAVFADLVNYDIDLQTDRITPATDIAFRIRLPEGWQNVSVDTITPDATPAATCQVEDGWVTLRLSRLVHYASLRVYCQLPPGMAHLMHAPAGHDFDAFVEEATSESERFRRRVLAGGDPDFVDAALLAAAILRFRELAPAYLQGHRNLDSFHLSAEAIVDALAGKRRLSSRRAFGGFEGKWFGQWDTMRVDHHWGNLAAPRKPRRVEIAGGKPVWVRSCQYCWVGDGYGLNLVATEDPESQSGDFLLGYVIHVEEGDLNRPTKRRPHVGLCVGKDKLIWCTAGEVFLEEVYEISPGVDAYAITGFSYKVADNRLRTTQCFQAIYTRNPDRRPDWFSFPLKFEVARLLRPFQGD